MKVGSVVRLRSGGPLMTVTEFHPAGSVSCLWFLGTELRSGLFMQGALVRAKFCSSCEPEVRCASCDEEME